jgi:hypothetical protein
MADTTNRLAGLCNLTIDGQSYMVTGDLSYSPSKVSRETLVGQDRVHGYSEKPHAGFISASLRDAGGLTVAAVNAMTNVSVVAELANGKTIVGRNMWSVNEQEVKTAEGTFEVKWEGFNVEEA